MLPTKQGAIRLFRFAGVTVYLHWSWFLVAAYEIQLRRGDYSSPLWNALEYLSLFAIVTMHEFGHSLACRSVGGKAERIVLWPLGGVAFVNPPPRPGALLWSIVAGPLVNVVLLPVTIGLYILVRAGSGPLPHSHLYTYCQTVMIINLALLVFNLLPIYPLDGGQILYSLLWFVLGRARGLLVASVVGLFGAAGVLLLAIKYQSVWWAVLAAFLGMQALKGFGYARALAWLDPAREHAGRALAAMQRGAFAEAIAECDLALELLPPGNELRAKIESCRALALVKLSEPVDATLL
jgi:Zn-dependent protease